MTFATKMASREPKSAPATEYIENLILYTKMLNWRDVVEILIIAFLALIILQRFFFLNDDQRARPGLSHLHTGLGDFIDGLLRIAYEGELERNLNADEVKEKMRQLLNLNEEDNSKARRKKKVRKQGKEQTRKSASATMSDARSCSMTLLGARTDTLVRMLPCIS